MVDQQFFQKIFLFQDMDAAELRQILKIAQPRTYPAGAVIITEGEAGTSMFIMQEGEVDITKRLGLVLDEEVPRERIIIRLKADEGVCFGEMALLENEPRSATVTAATDCHLLEIAREDFLTLIQQNRVLGCKLLLRLAQLLSRHLRKTNQDMVKLTTAMAIALGR
jgi:CRP/FNR family cyclic AMP-dependent transcriptional regulator|uniref:Cyclic nucleotide-binding domain-containing protein n=1 Tax=Desulfobacca acetoxidans TaxID=60893 RepID=A0A7V6DQW0_9BACT